MSSDPGLSLIMKDELALKKSSSVAEEVMSAVDQPASSSASLEAACLAAEPEGALPGSRRNTPSPELKESTWSEGTREPVPSSNLKEEGCHSPSLKEGCFGSGDPCVMEVSVCTQVAILLKPLQFCLSCLPSKPLIGIHLLLSAKVSVGPALKYILLYVYSKQEPNMLG